LNGNGWPAHRAQSTDDCHHERGSCAQERQRPRKRYRAAREKVQDWAPEKGARQQPRLQQIPDPRRRHDDQDRPG